MTRAARGSLALVLTLAAAPCTLAAPAPAPPGPPPSAPASPIDRLEQLDQLRADLELAKLRAAIAKANAEARDAALPAVAGAPGGAPGIPPLPTLGPGSPLFNTPMLASPGAAAGKGRDKAKAETPPPPTFTLVEAWGAGAERQAVLHSDAGDRLVRVGDQLPVGVITGIAGGAVSYRDAHGQTHTID